MEKRLSSTVALKDLLPAQGRLKVDYSQYDHIELTDEEIRSAIGYKKMLKSLAMEEQEKKEATRMMIERHRKEWSTEELREEVMDRITQLPFEFIVDEQNSRIIDLLCMYFSGNEKFNDEYSIFPDGTKVRLNLKKGIGLVSKKKGTGKSILMMLFQQNKFRPYYQMETKIISSLFQKKGDEAIQIHSDLLHVPPTPTFFYHTSVGICFDDLGFEITKNHWGSKSDVMADVLFSIYSKNQHKGTFNWFHFTSNLSGKDFEERYDDRIRDRMREMFNVIVVPGESRRK